jgi:hypothetical protein
MDQACIALPIIPGKTHRVRTFMQRLESKYARSGQRTGIVKESWHLQRTLHGDMLIAYLESPNLAEALRQLSTSQAPFDRWFKRQLLEVIGTDLSDPLSEGFSEQLAGYEARCGHPPTVRHLHV